MRRMESEIEGFNVFSALSYHYLITDTTKRRKIKREFLYGKTDWTDNGFVCKGDIEWCGGKDK